MGFGTFLGLVLVAIALRDGQPAVRRTIWRPLWEGEVVSLKDAEGNRVGHPVEKLLALPHGLIAKVDDPKIGLRAVAQKAIVKVPNG